ncbi:MAG: hypothetical protein ACREBN_07810, partial [Burkholderiaceae bacterium]
MAAIPRSLSLPALDGEADPENESTSESDRIVMALLYLLVQLATRGGDAARVMAIGQHLEMLSGRRDISPPLRATTLNCATTGCVAARTRSVN